MIILTISMLLLAMGSCIAATNEETMALVGQQETSIKKKKTVSWGVVQWSSLDGDGDERSLDENNHRPNYTKDFTFSDEDDVDYYQDDAITSRGWYPQQQIFAVLGLMGILFGIFWPLMVEEKL